MQPALPAAQSQAPGGQQPRTPRRAQNRQTRVMCPLCQILAQSANLQVEGQDDSRICPQGIVKADRRRNLQDRYVGSARTP
jgi:hypothetical protein